MGVDCFVDPFFVVADTEDPVRQSLLGGLDGVPESGIPVQVSVDVGLVGPSDRCLLALVKACQGRHVSRVTDVDDLVRLDVVDQLAEPLSSFVVKLVVSMGVWDNEMRSQFIEAILGGRA